MENNQTVISIELNYEESQPSQPDQHEITTHEGNNKEWRERSSQLSIILIGFYFVSSGPVQIFSDTFTVTFGLIAYLGAIFALCHLLIPVILMSDETQPNHRDGRWTLSTPDFHFLSGTLSATLLMVTIILMLSNATQMYLLLLIYPFLSFWATIIIFFFGLENNDHNQGTTDNTNEGESITKNTFRFASVAYWIGLLILPAKIGGDYWKNSGSFPSHYMEDIILEANASLISMIGVSTMAIISTPYRLKRNLRFLYVTSVRISMLVLLELAAASLASEFLDVNLITVLSSIVTITILMIYLRRYLLKVHSTENNSNKTEKEIHRMLGRLAGAGFTILTGAVYLAKSGYTQVFVEKCLVLFPVILSIIFSLIGMAYPFLEISIDGEVYKLIGHIISALVAVLVLTNHAVPFTLSHMKNGAGVASPPSA